MNAFNEIREICHEAAYELFQNGALLIDVCEDDELRTLGTNITDALHIALSDFDHRYREVPTDREVIQACRAGGRSMHATAFFVNHGYSRWVNMKKGMAKWVALGLPTMGDKRSHRSVGNCCSGGSCC